MTNNRTNLHATGIVLGRQGFLILGASGSGKSTLARALLQDAEHRGIFSALIADDQVWLESCDGRMIAYRPDSIKDLMEIRFSGIVRLPSVRSAVIDAVIALDKPDDQRDRLPQENETMTFFSNISLPVLRFYPAHSADLAAVENLMATRKSGTDQPYPS